jgi:hypothetical protein
VVHTLAKGDPKVVTALGLTVRADPLHIAELLSPTGLKLATSRAGVLSLH